MTVLSLFGVESFLFELFFKYFRKEYPDIQTVEATVDTNGCAETENEVNFIEQVEIIVTIQATPRGSLEIYLTSPMGTKSQILPVSIIRG